MRLCRGTGLLIVAVLLLLSGVVLAAPRPELIKVIEGEVRPLPGGKGYIYLPADEPVIQRYNLAGKKMWEYRYSGHIGSVAIHPKGRYIAGGLFPDWKLVLLDEAGGVVWEKEAPGWHVLFSADGNYILSAGGWDVELIDAHLYDLKGNFFRRFNCNNVFDISRDGQAVLIDGKVYTPRGKWQWTVPFGFPTKLSGDGKKVIVAMTGGIAYFSEGRLIWKKAFPISQSVSDIFISEDGGQTIITLTSRSVLLSVLSFNGRGEELWRWDPAYNKGAAEHFSTAVNFGKGLVVVGLGTVTEEDDNLYILDGQGQIVFQTRVGRYDREIGGRETRVFLAPDGESLVVSVGKDHFLYRISFK